MINLAEISPRILITVEAVKKQHIGQETKHPVYVRRISDKRAGAGGLEKFFSEAPAVPPFEHAACSKIDEIGFNPETLEGFANRLFVDELKHRAHFRGAAVKSEIKDR